MLTLVDAAGNVVSAQPQFICTGATGEQGAAGPTGPAGTTGQHSVTFLSNGTKATATNTCDPQQAINGVHPGFPTSITVPANMDVLITADGALLVGSGAAGSASIYDNWVTVDGQVADSTGQFYAVKRTYAAPIAITINGITTSTATVAPWSVTRRLSLTAGSHALALCSTFVGGSVAGFFAGDKNTVFQSALTVTFIAK